VYDMALRMLVDDADQYDFPDVEEVEAYSGL
jgi:hypothetical protein